MTGWEWGFLLLRVTTMACCLVAVVVLWRHMRHCRMQQERWLFLIGTTGFLLLLGGLTMAEAHRQTTLPAGQDIPLLDWFWLGTDLVLPLALMALLRVLRQRDALEARLVAAAQHDPLTGLPNRVGFAEAAALTLAQSARQRRPTATAVLDLDRFKRINDGWGHAAGDAVLRGVAQAMRNELRPGDVLARMGGEEFALLLPGLTAIEALPLLDRLREAVREGVPHPAGHAEQVTVSGGVADVPRPHLVALEEALGAADRALYAAKEAGRNRAMRAAA